MNQSKNGPIDASIEEIKDKIIKNREKILRDAKKIESGLSNFEESKNRKTHKRD